MNLATFTRRTAGLLLLLAVVLLLPSMAEACPSCKSALASEGQGDLVQGFFFSILFMLSMPFLILGTISLLMYRAVRQARTAATVGISTTLTATAVRKPTPSTSDSQRDEVPLEV